MAKKRPGKYAAVLGDLPKYIEGNPDYQARVNVLKDKILEPVTDVDETQPSRDILVSVMDHDMRSVLESLIHSGKGVRQAAFLGWAWVEARMLADKIDEWKSSVNLLLEALQQLAIDQMEVEGTTTMRFTEGRGCSVQWEPYPQVENRQAFHDWCHAQGLSNEMHLHPSTAAALAKRLLLEGQPEPDGMKTFVKAKLRLGAE